jgi:putative aldouronate transport system substrate-binding protein
MSNKKRAALLLGLAVAIGAFSITTGVLAKKATSAPVKQRQSKINTGEFPLVKHPISMTVFGSKDPNHAPWKDVLVLKEYEKMTNVKMIYQEVPSQGFEERKSLLFAANELPDVFIRANITILEIVMYGTIAKQLIPLEGLIDKYAPNFKKLMQKYPVIKQAITAPDGHIYTMPQVGTTNTLRTGFKPWINKYWLKKLGLKPPATLDEYVEVLRAFRDKDPNGNGEHDEIPMGLRDPGAVYTTIGGSWGLQYQMGYQINIENNKVKIWLTDPRFKEMLVFLNKLYKEKLLWQDYYKKDLPKWRSNLARGNFGLFYMPFSDVFLSVENNYIGFPPIKGPKGDRLWPYLDTPVQNAGAFAVSVANKHPEVAVKWVDYFYSDPGSLFFCYGIEGRTYTKKPDGTPVIAERIAKDPRGFMTALGEVNLVPGNLFPHLKNERTEGILSSDKTKEVEKVVDPYLPKVVYPAPIFDKTTADRIIPIMQDIEKFRDESVTKFIIGELGFDKWDEYVNTMQKIGLNEVEKAYQKALNKMIKK